MIKKGVAEESKIKQQISKPANPNKMLVENFVALQKVMTNLSIKFDNLADQISKLLELFEISAKALAEKEFNLEKGDKSTKKIIEKIDTLLEQNKLIARGLTLMHEKGTESSMPPIQRFSPSQYSQFPRKISSGQDAEEYHQSISSNKKTE